MKKITLDQIKKQADPPHREIFNSFAALSFDEKVKAFTDIRSLMRESFEMESKKQDERMCFIKDAFANLFK